MGIGLAGIHDSLLSQSSPPKKLISNQVDEHEILSALFTIDVRTISSDCKALSINFIYTKLQKIY